MDMSEVKKCGNCPRFIPDSKLAKELQENRDIYIYKGKCELNGKKMNPELMGCAMWK